MTHAITEVSRAELESLISGTAFEADAGVRSKLLSGRTTLRTKNGEFVLRPADRLKALTEHLRAVDDPTSTSTATTPAAVAAKPAQVSAHHMHSTLSHLAAHLRDARARAQEHRKGSA